MSTKFLELATRWASSGCPVPPTEGRVRDHMVLALLDGQECRVEIRTDGEKDLLYAVVDYVLKELIAQDPWGPGHRIIALRVLGKVSWPNDPMRELEDLTHRLSVARDDLRGLDAAHLIDRVAVLREEVELRPREIVALCAGTLQSLKADTTTPLLRVQMGELAMLIGAGLRLIGKLKESSASFDEAETMFRAENRTAELARLAFQRLAVALCRRELNEVAEKAPSVIRELRSFSLVESALKTEYVMSMALREWGDYSGSISILERIADEAAVIGSAKMTAYALLGLASIYAETGNDRKTVELAKAAESALRDFPIPIASAKLHWNLGHIFRAHARYREAERIYRLALQELSDLNLPADVAALRLVLTEVLLLSGRQADALAELAAAIPVIAEYDLVGEGIAALSLLRESLGHKRIDRSALRALQELLGRKP